MDPRDRSLWQISLEETASQGTTPGVFRALQERLKELAVLHAIAEVLQDASLTEAQALTAIAALIPQVFEHPEDAGVRIDRGGETFESPGFRESRFKLRAPFNTQDGREGAILVVYRRDHASASGGTFLPEERRLLESLAGRVAAALDRRTALQRLTLALSTGVRIWEWDIPADRLTWPDVQLGDPPTPLTAMFEEVLLYLHPDDRPVVRRAVEETFRDPARQDQMIVLCRVVFPGVEFPGQVYRWRHVTGLLVRDPKGRPIRMIGLSTDVSEQRELQDRLRWRKRWRRSTLPVRIAHDFNNIPIGVLGFGELALDKPPAGHPARGHVDEIMKAGDTARKCVHQIVAFSRRQELKPARIDFGAALRDWEEMIRGLIGPRYALECDVHPATPAVLADSGQLFQVVLNLSINARDAMPEGGAIKVRGGGRRQTAPSKDGAAGPERDWAVLEVQDTGEGMTPDVLPHIFEPFFTTKAAGRGTGMGLATVHGIVTQSGGFLSRSNRRWERGRSSGSTCPPLLESQRHGPYRVRVPCRFVAPFGASH
jgi:signal transduction histidine kinase